MEEVTIYTDGACSGNPGPGGWGAILMYKENKKEISGGKNDTTNNVIKYSRMLIYDETGSDITVTADVDSKEISKLTNIQSGWSDRTLSNAYMISIVNDVVTVNVS